MNQQPVTDHKGNKFSSFSKMCEFYNKPQNTVRNRLSRNWTLEQALTIDNNNQKHKVNHKKLWTDHKGNIYTSASEMCKAYNISEKVFWSRIRICKWDLEKTLTTPLYDAPSNAVEAVDHKGNKFKSVSEMCRFWDVKLSRYKERVKMGWSVEKALTEPAKNIKIIKKPCTDHLGNSYPSENAMCRAYNISRYTFTSRLKLGWTLEQALTAPYNVNKKINTDYKGQKFPTEKDKANYYNMPLYTFQGKKKNVDGENMIPLLIRRYKNLKIDNIYIINCVDFPYFLVRKNKDNNPFVMHFDAILNIYHNSKNFNPLPETKINNPIKIIKHIGFPYYLVNMDNQKLVMSYWDIINKNVENNFGLRASK